MCWVLEMDYVGFGTQNLNEFFEIINEVPGSLIESKTSFWSKYSNRIQDSPGNTIIIKYVNCKLPNHKILSGGNKLSQGSRHVPALDSSCPTSSMASRWACSSCWGLPRSRSAVKFWSIQGARWWRASRGKWSPATHKHWTLHWRLKWGKYGNSGRIGPAWCVLISVCSHDLLFLFRPGEHKNL